MSTIDNNVSTLESLGLLTPSKTQTASGSSELGQDAFLKLMIAQMQNQSPTDPMSNEQFMSQLAQFSTSSGVQELQKSFADFSTTMQSYQALQASGLVGRSVLVPTENMYLSQGGVVDGAIDVSSSTSQLVLNIYDQSGQLVRRANVGMQPAGEFKFAWDGSKDDGTVAGPGTYQIKAEALIDGKTTAMPTSVYAYVDSVNLSSRAGVQLNLAGLGSVELSEVKQVR